MIPIRNEQGQTVMYRHDPYAVNVLGSSSSNASISTIASAARTSSSSMDDMVRANSMSLGGSSTASRATFGAATPNASATTAATGNERSSSASLTDTLSDAGSETISSQPNTTFLGASSSVPVPSHASPSAPRKNQQNQRYASERHSSSATAAGTAAGTAAAPAVRFATIAFKFYTTICAAPFRCQPGDAVVVCDSATGHMNIGVVRSIRSEKPDVPVYLQLVRHARDFDRSQKNICMSQEPEMLATASSAVAAAFGPLQRSLVRFCDVEMNLDGGFITFLVDASRDVTGAMLGPVHALLTQHFGCHVAVRCAGPGTAVAPASPLHVLPTHAVADERAQPLSPVPVM